MRRRGRSADDWRCPVDRTRLHFLAKHDATSTAFWTQERVPNSYEHCSCTCCCYQIFNVEPTKTFFISQPIVIKLRLQIGDNIVAFCTVSDFKVKS